MNNFVSLRKTDKGVRRKIYVLENAAARIDEVIDSSLEKHEETLKMTDICASRSKASNTSSILVPIASNTSLTLVPKVLFGNVQDKYKLEDLCEQYSF